MTIQIQLYNKFYNNIFCADGSGRAVNLGGVSNFTSDFNLFHLTGGAQLGFVSGASITDFAQWQTITGQDVNSIGASPEFVDAGSGDYRLIPQGSAVDAG